MDKIKNIRAKEIFDSRGNPTLSVEVFTDLYCGRFDVPSGASTGKYEAKELRDNDLKRFNGLGVLKAISNIENKILPFLKNISVFDQRKIDSILIELDGTKDKSNLGANAILGVSVACAKAASKVQNKELYLYLKDLSEIRPSCKAPYLFMNFINGGKHSQSSIAFQEYMIVPQTDNINEAIEISFTIKNNLKNIILKNYGKLSVNIGDEGGFVPDCKNIKEPIEILRQSIKNSNLLDKVKIALDVAASSFYKDGFYEFDGKKMDTPQLIQIYNNLINDFNLLSIEDPFFEEDFDSFAQFRKVIPKEIFIVGDDLTVTNYQRLQQAIIKNSINAIIIKPNQIGTLTETLETMKLARDNNIQLIVSHRSGETNDDFIADLAFAFGCFGLKIGALQRGERIAKYNRLLEIFSMI
jgi:enolase